MSGNLSALIRSYVEPYDKRLTSSPSDSREYAALVDFYIKVALTLLAAYSKRTSQPIRLGPVPGVGEMLSGIRVAKKWTEQDAVITGWRKFAEIFLTEFSRNIYKGKTFKSIRDELSHGKPIPSDEFEAEALRFALSSFSQTIGTILDTQLSDFNFDVDATSIWISSGADKQDIAPLWDASEDPTSIGIYSSFESDGVYYLCPEKGIYRNRAAQNTQRFQVDFLGKTPEQKHFGQFVFEVTRDIAGFSENHSMPPYSFGDGVDAGIVFITWVHASSEQNMHRTDSFRLGMDNRYEWLNASGEWVGFSSFLRTISGWKVVARRIGLELAEQEKRKQIAETGEFKTNPGMKITPVLTEDSESASDENEAVIPLDLTVRADGACLPSKSFTTVFFVVGDAGLGKTEHLLDIARKRAQEVESDSSIDKPLYLFVSSAGRVLSNLDDAINTSLIITRNLNSHSAKVLCRNGLLVLVVDGFDELLGSSGYDNPLGSLEGWFRDLRGRGVIIASARSAYYMTRYRRSLSETTDLNVEHTVANIQPWSREDTERFLDSYNVSNAVRAGLTDRDWRLLSIPFFAKAFATGNISGDVANGATIVFKTVVDQYLERESTKILDQTNTPILNKDELRALFSEFAEMMHLEGKRELEQEDLEICTKVALGINDLDKDRAGLRRRLTSLCGLTAGEFVAGKSKFGFSHEVISDCFLSLSLERRCKTSVDKTYINNFVSKTTVNPAVIDWFVMARPQRAHAALTLLLQNSGSATSTAWKENVGTLWSALLHHFDGEAPHPSASGLVIKDIHLRKGKGTQLAMCDAEVGNLEIGFNAPRVDVRNTKIGYLQVHDVSTLRLLKNIRPELILEIRTPDQYGDTTSEIRTILENAEAIPRQANAAEIEWTDTVAYFIGKLVNKPDTPLVINEADYELADERLRWTQRLGPQKWTNFITRLIRCNLADLEIIDAKGQRKRRLVFKKSPAAIASHDSSSPDIEKFWTEL